MDIFLDMDGVICDFVAGAAALHNLTGLYEENNDYDIVKVSGLDAASFWSPMGYDFWANLPWTEHGKELVGILEERFGQSNICILSSPCKTRGCADGKIAWLEQFLPQYGRQYFLGPKKRFGAHPGICLVDDHDVNVDTFVAGGGQGVVVPAPWNRLRGFSVIESVVSQLDALRA